MWESLEINAVLFRYMQDVYCVYVFVDKYFRKEFAQRQSEDLNTGWKFETD